MSNIIHLGNGTTISLASSAYEDPTVAKDHRPDQMQRLKRRAQHIAALPRLAVDNGPTKFGPVSFMGLRADHCRWPLDDGRYCGKRKLGHGSYCSHHDAVAHRPWFRFIEAAE